MVIVIVLSGKDKGFILKMQAENDFFLVSLGLEHKND